MRSKPAGKSYLSLNVDTALLDRLKARAEAEGITVTAYLERLIREDHRAPEGPNWHEYQAAYQSALAVAFLTELVTNQYGEELTEEIVQAAADTMEQTFGAYPKPPRPAGRPFPENQ